jgi:hypothetical protein
MESTAESEQPIISNSFVTCYSDHLVIHLYYIPYGNKTIKYRDIRSCELLQMRDLNILKYKLWGIAITPVWWHADLRRGFRKYYILLDINKRLKVGITMNDNDIINVYKLIKQKMGRNQPFDSIENLDVNMISWMSENEFEHEKLLESNEAEYEN